MNVAAASRGLHAKFCCLINWAVTEIFHSQLSVKNVDNDWKAIRTMGQ